MESQLGFRWQVPLDHHVFIPFDRKKYRIALERITFTENGYAEGLHHVCIFPPLKDCVLWLNATRIDSMVSIVLPTSQGDDKMFKWIFIYEPHNR